MRIAALQMVISDGDPERNRESAAVLLDEARSADICLLPELWTCGYVHDKWDRLAAEDTPLTLKWMADNARERDIWLGGGLVTLDGGGGLRNSFVLFDRTGRERVRYHKVHLFPPLNEDRWFIAGDKLPVIVDIEGVRAAPAICYDLRFPEMFRRLAYAGAELLLLVAEWPLARLRPLLVLSEARAVENQCVLALANRVGTDRTGVAFGGGSALFGPVGELAKPVLNNPTVVGSVVDFETVRRQRAEFPVLQHRVLEVDKG